MRSLHLVGDLAAYKRPGGRRTRLGEARNLTREAWENQRLQHKLRKLQRTRAGRATLRERGGVEHRLAHLPRRQGHRARYRGVRKNLFDLRRACAIQKFETIQRKAA